MLAYPKWSLTPKPVWKLPSANPNQRSGAYPVTYDLFARSLCRTKRGKLKILKWLPGTGSIGPPSRSQSYDNPWII